MLVDSTGLKLCGPGEWLIEKHGTRTRRSWRKLYLGIDADTGQIVAASLTAKEVDDGAEVGALLDQVAGPVASFTADGGYDQDNVAAFVAERHPEAAILVPPAVHGRAEQDGRDRPSAAIPPATRPEPWAAPPTQRDRHLQHIAEHGRMSWQKASGYSKRALAEVAIGRWKRVIGDGLRAHKDECRATEVDVGVYTLNRMWERGRPEYVRVA